MGVVLNRKGRFATEGIRFQRHNPDGTIPTPWRFVGTASAVDLKNVVVDNEAEMTIKVDSEPAITAVIDLTSITNLANVPLTEIVGLLNAAPAFSTAVINFSIEPETERIMGNTSGGGKIIQCTGKLAAALDFGQSARFGGNGLEVISFFDDETISIGLPKDIKEKEEIDIEGAKGTITRMVIGAMLQGMSPVVTLKQKDYYLLELIQGGRLDRENGIYDPPMSYESEHPTFWAEIFSAVYSEGSNKLSDVAGYERILLRNMIGMEGDVPVEAKAWAQYAFNLTATEYTDANGDRFPAWQEQSMTLEQFDTLNVKKIAIEKIAIPA